MLPPPTIKFYGQHVSSWHHFCAQASHIGNGAVSTLMQNTHLCNLLSIFTMKNTCPLTNTQYLQCKQPFKNWSKKLVFFGPHFCAQASHIGNGAVATLRPNPHFCNLLSIFTIQTTHIFQTPRFFTLNNRLLISKQTCGWCQNVHIYNESDSAVSKTLVFQWKSNLAHMDDRQKWFS